MHRSVIALVLALSPSLASAAPARMFRGLRAGASWDFAGERIVERFDTARRTTMTHGSVHCELADLHAVRGTVVMTLACGGMANVQQLSGTYAASARGLARVEDDDPDVRAPLLGRRDVSLPGRRGTVTCFRWDIAAGDEAGWELCLTARDGIVGGSAYIAGGQTDDTYFGDAPRR